MQQVNLSQDLGDDEGTFFVEKDIITYHSDIIPALWHYETVRIRIKKRNLVLFYLYFCPQESIWNTDLYKSVPFT